MKLSLAFALSHQPRLLLLDEATAGLDPLARNEILDIFREFMEQEGHGILLSSHITSDLEQIADEIACIDNGRIAFDLSKDEICDRAGIVKCREADLDVVRANQYAQDLPLKFLKQNAWIDLLVPDRFEFKQAFPQLDCERASIDDYTRVYLRGQKL